MKCLLLSFAHDACTWKGHCRFGHSSPLITTHRHAPRALFDFAFLTTSYMTATISDSHAEQDPSYVSFTPAARIRSHARPLLPDNSGYRSLKTGFSMKATPISTSLTVTWRGLLRSCDLDAHDGIA